MDALFPLGTPERNAHVWLARHLYASISTLGQIVRSPVDTVATAAVIAIAIALPAGLYLTLENIRGISRDWEGGARISLYLSPTMKAEETEQLVVSLRDAREVAGVEIISPAQALEEYERVTGLRGLTDALGGENPLPTVLVVSLSMERLPSRAADQFADALAKRAGVDLVQSDWQWIERLHALLAVCARAVLILTAVFGLGIVLIVGNTIRLNVQSRREEIELCKLIGATDAFVRRPFLYLGAWYGLLGSLLAWGMVAAAVALIEGPARRLALLYHTELELSGLSGVELPLLILGGVFLGLIGAWVSVDKHLRDIERR